MSLSPAVPLSGPELGETPSLSLRQPSSDCPSSWDTKSSGPSSTPECILYFLWSTLGIRDSEPTSRAWTSLVHPTNVNQCVPTLTWEMAIPDKVMTDMRCGHAGTFRHRCKRLLTEQDRGRDTKRKDTGQGPRAGSLHTIMFPLKMPRRWRVLNWNLEFHVIDESIFVMRRRWSIISLAFLVWFITLNIQTYGMWASICTPDQESTNVRNKPDHWPSVPPHGLVLRVN